MDSRVNRISHTAIRARFITCSLYTSYPPVFNPGKIHSILTRNLSRNHNGQTFQPNNSHQAVSDPWRPVQRHAYYWLDTLQAGPRLSRSILTHTDHLISAAVTSGMCVTFASAARRAAPHFAAGFELRLDGRTKIAAPNDTPLIK